jgi:hypothetical protein
MGQDTRCKIGVTYHCKYIPKNRTIIEKLLKMEDISAFIQKDEDSDEVLEITDAIIQPSDMFNADILAEEANGWYGHENIKIIGNDVIFKVNVYEAHVRNMSRRHHCLPFYDECFTAVEMIKTLQKIVNELKSFGIKEKDLSIGHTITDDH